MTTDEKLAAFGLRVLEQWQRGEWMDLDGGDLHAVALETGVFAVERRATPCGPGCECAEYERPTAECVGLVEDVWQRVLELRGERERAA